MKIDISQQKHFSLATIVPEKSDIVKAVITVDTHTKNNLKTQTIQHLYPDAILSGAGKYNREGFLNAVNTLGASIDISVTDGKVTIILRSTATQFKKLLQLVEIMIQHPSFSTSELKRVKSTALNQLHEAKEDSKTIALEQLRNQFYGSADRRYSYAIKESEKEVPLITKTNLTKYHSSVVSGVWCCSIAGNKETVKTFVASMNKLKRSDSNVTEGIHQPKPPQPALSLENIPSKQNIDLSIGSPFPITRTHPDFIPLGFAVAVLGKWGGFAGRLMSTVREKEGLTYGIYGQLEGFSADEQGYLRIMTFFAPDKTVQGLTSTFREIAKLHKSGVTQAEVDSFKMILNTQQTLVNDSLGRMLSDLHGYHCEGFSIEEMKEYKDSLLKVTKADINRVVKTYLDPSLMSVSGAGPTAAVQKALRTWYKNV
jgi:zinc protease